MTLGVDVSVGRLGGKVLMCVYVGELCAWWSCKKKVQSHLDDNTMALRNASALPASATCDR